jgi:hypothetical protein
MSTENNVDPGASKPTSDEPRYAAIAAALGSSSWGRWFLHEHAKRAGTEARGPLLAVLSQLEGALRPGGPDVARAEPEATRVLGSIARELEGVLADETDEARSLSIPALMATLDQSASTLREASEGLQEVAWDLRGHGANTETCDTLEKWTTQIARSSSAQAEAVARVDEILRLLEQLNKRLTPFRDVDPNGGTVRSRKVIALADHRAAITESADRGTPAERGEPNKPETKPFLLDGEPPPPVVSSDEGLCRVMDHETSSNRAGLVAPAGASDMQGEGGAAPETNAEGRRREWFAAFAEIDALDLREKLRLFT